MTGGTGEIELPRGGSGGINLWEALGAEGHMYYIGLAARPLRGVVSVILTPVGMSAEFRNSVADLGANCGMIDQTVITVVEENHIAKVDVAQIVLDDFCVIAEILQIRIEGFCLNPSDAAGNLVKIYTSGYSAPATGRNQSTSIQTLRNVVRTVRSEILEGVYVFVDVVFFVVIMTLVIITGVIRPLLGIGNGLADIVVLSQLEALCIGLIAGVDLDIGAIGGGCTGNIQVITAAFGDDVVFAGLAGGDEFPELIVSAVVIIDLHISSAVAGTTVDVQRLVLGTRHYNGIVTVAHMTDIEHLCYGGVCVMELHIIAVGGAAIFHVDDLFVVEGAADGIEAICDVVVSCEGGLDDGHKTENHHQCQQEGHGFFKHSFHGCLLLS